MSPCGDGVHAVRGENMDVDHCMDTWDPGMNLHDVVDGFVWMLMHMMTR